MSACVVRVDLEGVFKLFLCALPSKLVPPLDRSHGAMSFSECVIEFQCARGGGFGFFHIFARRDGVEIRGAEKRISVGQTRPGKRISRIDVSRLLKAYDCFAASFLVAFVPVVTAFYIEAMSFRILRIMFGELLFFIRSEIDPQRLGQTLGDWTLNRIKPARILVELHFPQQRSVTCFRQLHCDVPAFADLSYPAVQHSIDLLFTAN